MTAVAAEAVAAATVTSVVVAFVVLVVDRVIQKAGRVAAIRQTGLCCLLDGAPPTKLVGLLDAAATASTVRAVVGNFAAWGCTVCVFFFLVLAMCLG